MGSEVFHNQKYIGNKEFLCDGINKKGNYRDWEVVVAFYCAVHLIEKVLARDGINSDNHTDRSQKIKSIKISNIADLFKAHKFLLQLSYEARYECISINENDVTNAHRYLEEIEGLLQKVK